MWHFRVVCSTYRSDVVGWGKMSQLNEGMRAWQRSSNHNRMIELQANPLSDKPEGDVQLSYFGASSFRIQSPNGITVLIDPWRNHPSGKWDWYRGDFPVVTVDICCSTHAHFDHDAVHLWRCKDYMHCR